MCMKLTNSNGFLTTDVTGRKKGCSDYIFLKKYLKDCSPEIVLHLEQKQNITKYEKIKQNITAIKPAK